MRQKIKAEKVVRLVAMRHVIRGVLSEAVADPARAVHSFLPLFVVDKVCPEQRRTRQTKKSGGQE